jgi:hypothetical protein
LPARSSLESFKQLLQEKGPCLARPDVLISAVGTKVRGEVREGVWTQRRCQRRRVQRGTAAMRAVAGSGSALVPPGDERMRMCAQRRAAPELRVLPPRNRIKG